MGKVQMFVQVHGDPNRYDLRDNIVSGEIVVRVNKGVEVNRLLVQFLGKSKCKWTKTHRNSQNNTSTTVTYKSKEMIVELAQDLLAVGRRIPLQPGEYKYPFRFQLQNTHTFPPTYTRKHGRIEYLIKAKLDREGGVIIDNNVKVKAAIHINNAQIYINQSQFLQPYSRDDEFTSCCCCCADGPVIMKASVNKTGYAFGENCEITLEIENSSGSSLRPSVTVKEEVEFTAKRTGIFSDSSDRKHSSAAVLSSGCDKVPANTRHNKRLFRIPINASQMNPDIRTSNIKLTHYILVKLSGASMTFRFPLTIGRQ